MQATLLGIGIAIILALLAALVGPYYVDWNNYRPTFEAEASRITGMKVQVRGTIDVRLLPVPSLVLRGIEASKPGAPATVKANELSVQFALGPLLQGKLQASELRIAGAEFAVGLDDKSRIEWPGTGTKVDADALSIDRLVVEDSRALLTDAASGKRLTLDKMWFNGDLRSLAGPVRGEGEFFVADERYGYQISAGRPNEGKLRLHLALNPVDRPFSLTVDGVARMENDAPLFEGVLALSRPVGLAKRGADPKLNEPWNARAKIKATQKSAVLEDVTFQYGPDDRAIKLTGAAQLTFGKNPRLETLLSAHQIDLDRMMAAADAPRRPPLAAMAGAVQSLAAKVQLPLPAHVGLSIDALTLGGAVLQSVRGDIALSADGWNLETFELRAPGFTEIRTSGRLRFGKDGVSFAGPVNVQSLAPKALIAWLGAQPAPKTIQSGEWHARGDLTLAADRFAIERLKAEVDKKPIEGRLVYIRPTARKAPRLVADLRAAEIDDDTVALVRAVLGDAAPALPGEVALAVEVGRVRSSGIEAKKVSARVRLDGDVLAIEKLSVGDLGGAGIDVAGRIDGLTTTPRGSLTLDLDAKSFEGTTALLAKFLPQAENARDLIARLAPAKLHAKLDVERADDKGGTEIALVLDGGVNAVKLALHASARGKPSATDALALKFDGKLNADDGQKLVALLGLDRYAAVDKRTATLTLRADGSLKGGLNVDATLVGGGLTVSAKGPVHLSGERKGGPLDVSVAAADLSPLWRTLGARKTQPVAVRLASKAALAGDKLTLENLSGEIADSRVNGRIEIAIAKPLHVSGEIETRSLDLGSILGTAVGLPQGSADAKHPWSSEPFAPAFGALVGDVTLKASVAALTADVSARDVTAHLHLAHDTFAIEVRDGFLAGGKLDGSLVFNSGVQGLAAKSRVTLSNVNVTAIVRAGARPPIDGRLTLTWWAEGSGLSPAALIGSLMGKGRVTLTDARLAGLDPRAIDSVVRAVDQGMPIEGARLRDMVATALDGGQLALGKVEADFAIRAGQVQWGTVVAKGEGADLTVNGGADLAEWSLDARLMLTAATPPATPANTRPDIYVSLHGPLAGPQREVDTSAFAAWLTLRRVDIETKKLEAAEKAKREAEKREVEEMKKRDAERREAEIKQREADERALAEAKKREAERAAAKTTLATPPDVTTTTLPEAERVPAPAPPVQARPRANTVRPPATATIAPQTDPLATTKPKRPTVRRAAPKRPAVKRAPTLPPPIEIKPRP